ncbi:MAG TPA: Asp-tRNA(Asn)/Glu-tRNA(Gln) amidotransferase subunit GatB [Candidatus Paceibacterota bacterium]|nr:Asp-tRNA(Asn)/Glu-tRNA(Gln) amidotransferase subunit GatB [Candidatus Paceibacterota bacterium]
MAYKPTIGLEIHAELKTRTKMFCDSLNDSDEKQPNTNVCPVCLGHPGALPTINKQAVEHVIKVGLAVGGKPSTRSRFDRKNYFYPDLPKAYQISQSGEPLMLGGELAKVKINHIHLEEDAGKLVHDDASNSTLVDYNRAGVPLMELVTEPDLHSAENAVVFMRELQLVLRYLGVSDADLERGQLRADANISVSPDDKLGIRSEVKNLNSFNSVLRAIDYEIKRQTEMLERGETVRQETRGWDDVKQKTTPQRSKEEAQDYRYFPEPDLPPFETAVFEPEKLRDLLPELPGAKRVRFAAEYRLNTAQTDTLVFEPKLAEFFEEAASELKSQISNLKSQTLFNYLTSDLRGLMNETGVRFADLKVTPEHLAHLVSLIEKGVIGSRQAKDVLKKTFETGLDPEDVVKNEGLETVSDAGELGAIVKEVIEKNPKAAEDYKKGKAASAQFLVGQAMAKLKGRGDPQKLRALIERLLK